MEAMDYFRFLLALVFVLGLIGVLATLALRHYRLNEPGDSDMYVACVLTEIAVVHVDFPKTAKPQDACLRA